MQTHAILCRLVAFVFVSTSADAIDQQLCRCKCIHAERWMNWISRYIQLLVCHFVWLRDIFNISCDWIVQGSFFVEAVLSPPFHFVWVLAKVLILVMPLCHKDMKYAVCDAVCISIDASAMEVWMSPHRNSDETMLLLFWSCRFEEIHFFAHSKRFNVTRIWVNRKMQLAKWNCWRSNNECCKCF